MGELIWVIVGILILLGLGAITGFLSVGRVK